MYVKVHTIHPPKLILQPLIMDHIPSIPDPHNPRIWAAHMAMPSWPRADNLQVDHEARVLQA